VGRSTGVLIETVEEEKGCKGKKRGDEINENPHYDKCPEGVRRTMRRGVRIWR